MYVLHVRIYMYMYIDIIITYVHVCIYTCTMYTYVHVHVCVQYPSSCVCTLYIFLHVCVCIFGPQGFWDMVYIQVEDVYRRFEGLTELEQNNWKPPQQLRRSARQRKKVNTII